MGCGACIIVLAVSIIRDSGRSFPTLKFAWALSLYWNDSIYCFKALRRDLVGRWWKFSGNIGFELLLAGAVLPNPSSGGYTPPTICEVSNSSTGSWIGAAVRLSLSCRTARNAGTLSFSHATSFRRYCWAPDFSIHTLDFRFTILLDSWAMARMRWVVRFAERVSGESRVQNPKG